MAEGDPAENFEKINKELELYSPELVEKPQVVVGTKLDITGTRERCERLQSYCKMKNINFFPVSAATGSGVKNLLSYLSAKLEEMRSERRM
jgi:GTP-binding protein